MGILINTLTRIPHSRARVVATADAARYELFAPVLSGTVSRVPCGVREGYCNVPASSPECEACCLRERP